MVALRRRRSLLGVLALLGGIASLLCTKIHLLALQTVTIHSVTLPLGIAMGVGAMAVALIALAGAAASPRTGTALPIAAVVVSAGALLLAFKPNLFSSRAAPPVVAPAAPPAAPGPAPQPAVANPPPHVKTIFDNDDSAPTSNAAARRNGTNPSAGVPARATPAAPSRPDAAAALRAARDKLDAARANVLRSLESSDHYRDAKSAADAADADLKAARQMYPPGSTALIAADKAAIEAHKAVQKLITDAAAKDPLYQDAVRQLRSAQSAAAHGRTP